MHPLTPDYVDELANIEASRLIRAEMMARHAGHAAFEGHDDVAADFMAERARLMANPVAAALSVAASTTKQIDRRVA